MDAKQKDALERGMEMLAVKIKDVPPIAREFADYLCNEVGMCIEVFLTAYTAYAQCVEGLPCSHDLYVVSAGHREWFREKGIDC